jgi:NAD-dependent protein deacetylase/lipoamidase
MSSLHDVIQWIETNSPGKIAVLTGAGISEESGIPTFRGSGGLWENYRAEELATPEAFARDPATVWRWYEWRRSIVRKAEPNLAHIALSALEDVLAPRGSVTVITQNVDELHRRAGSQSLIELHGSIFRVRCVRDQEPRPAPDPFAEVPPRCECGALLRPDVVWFGEPLPQHALAEAAERVSQADLLLIVGTSGLVYPAAGLAGVLRHGVSVEINPQSTPLSASCDFVLSASACDTVPFIGAAIARNAE